MQISTLNQIGRRFGLLIGDQQDIPVARRSPLFRYGVALLATAAAVGIRAALGPIAAVPISFVLFIGAVIASAWFGGLRPGLISTAIGAILAFIANPELSVGWIVRLALFVMEGVTISMIIDRLQQSWRIAQLSRISAKRLEEQSRQSEERFRGLLESAPDAMVIVNDQGVITLVNTQTEKLLGYSRRELIGQPVELLVDPEKRAEHVALRQKYMTDPITRSMGHSLDVYARRKDSSRVPVEVSLGPVKTSKGLLITATIRDVTERKKISQELQKAKDEAEAANRAKDHFLAMLSHELRTPLTPALMTAASLESSPELNLEIRQEMHIVRRNIELEARLIDDLLDITRISRGKLMLNIDVVDVHSLLQSAVQICQGDIDAKSQHLSTSYLADHRHVRGDAARLQQAFWNLLKNANKFTPTGGQITIRTRNEPVQPRLASLVDDRELLVIEFGDSGIGIPRESLEKIFDVFEQTESKITREFGGLGLGLAISKNLVEMHDGTIAASSPGPSLGSTFTVKLPVVPAPVHNERPVRPPEVHALHPLKLLLVEDHPDTLDTMVRLLRGSGYQVVAARSLAEALQAAASVHFEVLISDIGLPDGSGHELIRQLRQRQNVKAIALTGFGDDDDIERALQAGFDAHMTKPVAMDQLNHTIERLTAKAETAP